MSNSIELDLTANTSQAQKAISDLTKDVDNLQRKASQTSMQMHSAGASSVRNNVTSSTSKSGRDGAASFADLKGAFSNISNQLSGLSAGLGNAINGLSNFSDSVTDTAAKLLIIKQLASDFRKVIKRGSADAKEKILYNRAPVRNIERVNRTLNSRATGASIMLDRISRAGSRSDLTDAQITQLGDWNSKYSKLRSGYLRQMDRNKAAQMFGPLGGRVSAAQYGLRAIHQFAGAADSPFRIAPRARTMLGYAGLKPGFGAGMASMAGMGARLMQAPLAGAAGAAMGAGRFIGSGLTALTGLSGGALAAGGGIAAGAAALASPFIWGGMQVSKGRDKAEELTALETQFKQLAKNISGVEIDTLSKDLQKLGIEGVVPVEQLSRGASMLMLAFKGNQKETSKWTQILADMSAGTGQSVEYFAELITKANQFGTVEFEVFNQLNEKGIPIIEQLQGKFGDTREEIMKAAQAGKITADEFMKAFEAAHKASMEGANAVKAAASLKDVQRQTEQYEELLAAEATKAYDDAQMDYDLSRRDRAAFRAADEGVIAATQAAGDCMGKISLFFRDVGNWFSDTWTDAMHSLADWKGLDDKAALDTLRDMAAKANASLQIDESWDSNNLQARITELEGFIDRANKMANTKSFDPSTRREAIGYRRYIEDILNPLKDRLTVVKREESIAEGDRIRAQREDERRKDQEKTSEWWKKERIKDTKDESKLLEQAGFKNYEALQGRMDLLRNSFENGSATSEDKKEWEILEKLEQAITALRKSNEEEAKRKKNEETKKAEEERKQKEKRDDYSLESKNKSYSNRYQAEYKIKYHEEAEKLRKKGYSESQIEKKLAKKDLVQRAPENYKGEYELKYTREAQKMRDMGFTQEEIDKKLKETKKNDIYSLRGELAENEEKIKQEEYNIKRAKMVGKEGIQNAWGSVERMATSFSSPYEQNSLKELKDINKNLKSEINAIKGINTKSKAE